MSDLRTRIAAAIYDASPEYTRQLMVNPLLPGCADVDGDSKPVCYRLADAVIRELGLHREDNEADFTGPYRHRYVTEWRTNE